MPYHVFACADGHLILAVGNDSQFAKFCALAGKPEWAADPRFAKNADRVRNRDVLVPLIAAVVRTRTQKAWLDALEPLGIPCGPINRMDQVFADPQVVARGLRTDLPHPLAGTVPQVRTPLEFSRDAACLRPAAAVAGRAHGGGPARAARHVATTRSRRSPRAT